MATTKLDPTKEIVGFKTGERPHVSLADHPENKKEFLLVQDSYSTQLGDAVGTLVDLLGPLIDHMVQEVQDALQTCQDYLGGLGLTPPPVGQTMMSDTEFDYAYPEPVQIAEALVNLDAVPEDADVYEATHVLASFLRNYTPEEWIFSPTLVYSTAEAVKSKLTDSIVRFAADGKDVSNLALAASALKPSTGVLVLAGSGLWDIVRGPDPDEPDPQPEPDPEPTADRADISPADRAKLAKAGDAMPDGSYPIQDKNDLENAVASFGRAKDPTAVKAWITKKAKELGVTDVLPADWAWSTKKSDLADITRSEEMSTANGEAKASSYLRSLMLKSDPSLGVESDEPASGGGDPVNVQQERVDVPEGFAAKLQQARSALATPGMTEEQKESLVNHFMGQLKQDLLPQEDRPVDITMALRAAIEPLVERLDLLERYITEPESPRRRSLRSLPQRDEDEPMTNTYHPRNIRSLAESNTLQ